MSLEVKGKIVQILQEVSGTSPRGEWKKRDFIVETDDQYPKKVCFSVWSDKVDELKRFEVESVVNVSFNVESREYNGKWYTDLRAWKIDAETVEAQHTERSSTQTMPSTELPNIPPVSDDDLPF